MPLTLLPALPDSKSYLHFCSVKDYITISLSKFRYLKTKKNMVGEKNGQMEIVVRLARYCMSFFILTKYEFLEISDKVKQAPS